MRERVEIEIGREREGKRDRERGRVRETLNLTFNWAGFSIL